MERVTKITQLHKNDVVRWCEQLIVGRRYYDPHMPEKTQRRFGGTPNLRSALAAQGVVANDTAQIRPMSHASQVGLEQTKRKPV